MAAVEFTPLESSVMGWGLDIYAGGGPLIFLHGGASVAWDTVAAVAGTDVVLADGTVCKVGEKWLFPGQVLIEITSGPNIRMYGPYDPTTPATDGRQTIGADVNAGIVRKPVQYRPDLATRFYDSTIGLVIGGPVKRGMIRATSGAASLAAGPTWANIHATFPTLVLVANLRGAHT